MRRCFGRLDGSIRALRKVRFRNETRFFFSKPGWATAAATATTEEFSQSIQAPSCMHPGISYPVRANPSLRFDRGLLFYFGFNFFNYFVRQLSDLGPNWSGKDPDELIMDDKYSQTPYGDFWTDSRTIAFCEKQPKPLKRPQAQNRFFSKSGFWKSQPHIAAQADQQSGK